MKKYTKSAVRNKALLIFFITLTAFCMLCFTFKASNPQDYVLLRPKACLSGKIAKSNWKVNLQSCMAEGKFSLSEGVLENISDFRFTLKLNQISVDSTKEGLMICEAFKRNQSIEVVFSQNKLMILPLMKMVHMIGDIKIKDRSASSAIQFQYTFEQGGQIHFYGKQVIYLSEYGIRDDRIIPGSYDDLLNICVEFSLSKKDIRLMK